MAIKKDKPECKTCNYECTWFCEKQENERREAFKRMYPFFTPMREGESYIGSGFIS